MARKTKRGAGSRTPLSRERVLRAAITLADEGGIESLSMRKLGQALGVEAMSLYRHVANRDEILDGIIEMVVGEIDVPAKGVDWKMAMRRRAISAHEVLLRHPWASALIESRAANVSPAMLRYADAIIGSLREAGFPIAIAYRAFLTLDSYIYGFTLQEVSWPDAEEIPDLTARLRARITADAYPNVSEIMGYVVDSRTARAASKGKKASDYSSEFEFGLDLILGGFERLRGAAR